MLLQPWLRQCYSYAVTRAAGQYRQMLAGYGAIDSAFQGQSYGHH
ncbi:hypothetical protein AEST_04420 [Alishewanella aestuarii B11]|uniref:Uncharacterized protein n=1 Tax=Alishewanella aestuarii B11 TaxID=1197174 RepID=J1QMS2_9ALTE|nr:hypothetical protein AEST_04420 [Alishewanella aestuarii B11]